MIKVTVKNRYLNVRVGHPLLSAPSYQYIAPGSEIEVDGILYPGDSFEGNFMWLKDSANNYYWSGGVSGLPSGDHLTKGKVTFDWFKQLGIADIWQTYQTRGENVKVAVLDSGYRRSISDLAKIDVKNTKVIIDAKFYKPSALLIDDVNDICHGTRCASLIGASNNGNWNVGIAPECELLIGKTYANKAFIGYDYMIDAIEWALSKGADIISASFAIDLTLVQADDFAKKINAILNNSNRQVLLFASAGNIPNGMPNTHDFYPAMFDRFISVGAFTASGKLSTITALNNKTIIHAPGENIESYGAENEPTPWSGTSFSTPIIAGIAALAISYLKQKNGDWNSEDLINKMNTTGNKIEGHENRKMINPYNLFKNL